MKYFLPIALVALAVCAYPAQAAPAAAERVSAAERAPSPEARVLSTAPEALVFSRAPFPGPAHGLLELLGLATFALGTVALGGSRTLQQTQLTATTALPAAGATLASAGIDTNTVTPGRIPDVELGVTIPALPSLADAHAATFTVQDSADGVTYADLADIPPIVLTGGGGVGAAAVDRRFKIPIAMRQFFRLNQAVAAAGGDNTAVSSSIGLYF